MVPDNTINDGNHNDGGAKAELSTTIPQPAPSWPSPTSVETLLPESSFDDDKFERWDCEITPKRVKTVPSMLSKPLFDACSS
jgi:hypothetical protein